MTLANIRDQIVNRLADVIGARAKFYASPEGLPEPVPCVITSWKTQPVRERYGIAPAMKNRLHTITSICVLSQRTHLPDEDAAGTRIAEQIAEAFEDDGRLNGLASSCDVQLIEPITLEYGSATTLIAYYALRVTFAVKETQT